MIGLILELILEGVVGIILLLAGVLAIILIAIALFSVMLFPLLYIPTIPLEKRHGDLRWKGEEWMEDPERFIAFGKVIWSLTIIVSILVIAGYIIRQAGGGFL